MPIVTVDPTEYERRELKSAPPDPNDPSDEQGYIMVRPLPYGKKLARRDKASRMKMNTGDGKGKPSTEIQLETLSEWATQYDFAYCIGDHNLTDKNKVKVDFTNPMSFALLDPKVGTEIAEIIDALNEDEDDESIEDFLKRQGSSSSSTGETTSEAVSNESSETTLVK